MANLYDASILTGPASLEGAVIRAQGRLGGTHRISAVLDPLELSQASSADLSKGDIIVLAGVEYRVESLHFLRSYVEYADRKSVV